MASREQLRPFNLATARMLSCLKNRDLDSADARIAEMARAVDQLDAQVQARVRAIESLQADIAHLQRELQSLYDSRTWRWSAPVRSLLARLGFR